MFFLRQNDSCNLRIFFVRLSCFSYWSVCSIIQTKVFLINGWFEC